MREKKIVPLRKKRMEEMGDPKTPKMGSVTPKTVQAPVVGDLIEEMRQATLSDLLTIDYAAIEEMLMGGRCKSNCHCPPCERGDCDRCYVDAQRNADRKTVRAYVAEYRGVKFE